MVIIWIIEKGKKKKENDKISVHLEFHNWTLKYGKPLFWEDSPQYFHFLLVS